MAGPMAALAAKAAAGLVEDKRLRTFVASVLAGLVIMLLIPFLALVSIANAKAGYSQEIARIVFDGGEIPENVSEELAEYMEEMMDAFERLEIAIEDFEDVELDETKVKSFFYVLYFIEDKPDFDSDFYEDFVNCFTDTEDDEEICSALETFLPYSFTESEKEEIHELYLFIKFGYSSTNQMGGITGIPGEAFSDETFAKLMGEATKHIGKPYVWGGSTPSTSFDCSGFVCWSYTKSGVYNLPRTTAQGIYNQCAPVAKEDLKPGDLVFFTGTYNSSSPVSHIGIYVGDNQMLHAGDPIGYANLGNSYWIKHWYGGGRLLE